MDRKLCLIVAATVAVIATGSTPIGAQQPGAANTLMPGTKAVLSTIQGTAVNWTNGPDGEHRHPAPRRTAWAGCRYA